MGKRALEHVEDILKERRAHITLEGKLGMHGFTLRWAKAVKYDAVCMFIRRHFHLLPKIHYDLRPANMGRTLPATPVQPSLGVVASSGFSPCSAGAVPVCGPRRGDETLPHTSKVIVPGCAPWLAPLKFMTQLMDSSRAGMSEEPFRRDYEIDWYRMLGSGTFGEVYVGTEVATKKEVAM